MTAVEWCCGAGGSGLGVARAGIRTLAAYDSDPRAVATYNANLQPVARVADVREVWRDAPEADLWVATLPCQPFSDVGRQAGNADPRDLFPWLFASVSERRPAWLLIENVPGLRRWYDPAQTVRGLGYRAWQHVQAASDFGVPQPRRRLLCVATTTAAPFQWPTPQIVWQRDMVMPRAVGVPLDRPVSVAAADYRGASGAGFLTRHPASPRRLSDALGRAATLDEMCRMQGFPASWTWPQSMKAAKTLVGNAVPPAVAAAFAREIVAADRAARAAAVVAAAKAEAARDPQAVIAAVVALSRDGRMPGVVV